MDVSRSTQPDHGLISEEKAGVVAGPAGVTDGFGDVYVRRTASVARRRAGGRVYPKCAVRGARQCVG